MLCTRGFVSHPRHILLCFCFCFVILRNISFLKEKAFFLLATLLLIQFRTDSVILHVMFFCFIDVSFFSRFHYICLTCKKIYHIHTHTHAYSHIQINTHTHTHTNRHTHTTNKNRQWVSYLQNIMYRSPFMTSPRHHV